MNLHLEVPKDEDESASAHVAVFFLSDRTELTVVRKLYSKAEAPKNEPPSVLFSVFRKKRRKEEIVLSFCLFARALPEKHD